VAQLSAEVLAVSFGDAGRGPIKVLEGIDFAPSAGALTVVGGASGSGKSTLLHVLSGIIRPNSGRVLFDGADISGLGEGRRDRWRRDHVGLVFQSFHLIEELNPRDNVLVAAWFDRFSAAKLKGRADTLLEDLGVPAGRRKLRDLSRGEQQRVAIARALLFDPPIVIADEPTASLDREAAKRVASLLGALAHRDGRTVVVASHDLDIKDAADSVVELAGGHLKQRHVVAA